MNYSEGVVDDVTDGCWKNHKTGCLIWLGRCNAAGHPMAGRDQTQHMVSRYRWLEQYRLKLPRGPQLRRLCSESLCVAPWHRCISNPTQVLRREGISTWRLSRLRGAMRRKQGEEPEWPVKWLGELKALSCAPYALERVALKEDVSVLTVLAVYATLIPKEVT